MKQYARIRNSDKKILEFRDHPDGHIETLAAKFGSDHAEQWLPVEKLADETPGPNQGQEKKQTVLADKVLIQKVVVDMSADEVKRKEAMIAGEVLRSDMPALFASMEKGTVPQDEDVRKICLFLLSQAGVTK